MLDLSHTGPWQPLLVATSSWVGGGRGEPRDGGEGEIGVVEGMGRDSRGECVGDLGDTEGGEGKEGAWRVLWAMGTRRTNGSSGVLGRRIDRRGGRRVDCPRGIVTHVAEN